MSRLIVTRTAVIDIKRCCDFLNKKSPKASIKAYNLIADKLELLTSQPNIGRIVEDGLRELIIEFGASGYIALYKYDSSNDSVYVLVFRHQKEAGQ
ncbi:MAG: type II toxin-antitoxin system RelE/ParE family toxin [Neisseriaceae bacterium]|jgi:plasmid stabilization system protein ParE